MSSSDATSLRVALVIHALQGGGAERLMSQLANRWAEAGHEVHLITLALPCPSDYSLDAQVQRHGLGLVGESGGACRGAWANWRRVQRLKQVLQQLRPEFILSFCDQMNIVAATAARQMNVPRWLVEHSDPRRQQLGFLWEHWRNWAYLRASGLIVLTDAIAAHMRQRFPRLPIQVIPPATAPAGKPATYAVAAHPSQQPGVRTLLAMGRHSPEKNYAGLLRAWKLIEARYPQWRLVLAGDGPEHRSLQALSAELGLKDRVHFPGWVHDPWEWLASAEVVVVSSTYEGVPLALLEAMSLGRVCIASPCCDSVTTWAQAGALIQASSESPQDLADAMQRVLDNPAACAPISQAAISVSQDYSWSHVGSLWDQLLLANAVPSRP